MSSGRWTAQESNLFNEATRKWGKDWIRISKYVKTRTPVQVRSHAQKVLQKSEVEAVKPEGVSSAERADAGKKNGDSLDNSSRWECKYCSFTPNDNEDHSSSSSSSSSSNSSQVGLFSIGPWDGIPVAKKRRANSELGEIISFLQRAEELNWEECAHHQPPNENNSPNNTNNVSRGIGISRSGMKNRSDVYGL